MEPFLTALAVIALCGVCFYLFLIEPRRKIYDNWARNLMANHHDISIKILTVVGNGMGVSGVVASLFAIEHLTNPGLVCLIPQRQRAAVRSLRRKRGPDPYFQ
jgi:hypothetical protein